MNNELVRIKRIHVRAVHMQLWVTLTWREKREKQIVSCHWQQASSVRLSVSDDDEQHIAAQQHKVMHRPCNFFFGHCLPCLLLRQNMRMLSSLSTTRRVCQILAQFCHWKTSSCLSEEQRRREIHVAIGRGMEFVLFFVLLMATACCTVNDMSRRKSSHENDDDDDDDDDCGRWIMGQGCFLLFLLLFRRRHPKNKLSDGIGIWKYFACFAITAATCK